MGSKNAWRKIDEDYWMCFQYDVWREFGVWYSSFIWGDRYPKDFSSAEDAMKYCDQMV